MSDTQYGNVNQTLGANDLIRKGFVGSLASGATRAFDIVLQWQQRAVERHRMLGFSEHELKDIGISRADVEVEASKPFWRA